MVSWVPLFDPGPGTTVKDMDVVGDYCVLVARTPASELILIVVPLTNPKEAYTVQVSVTENYFLSLHLLLFSCCLLAVIPLTCVFTIFLALARLAMFFCETALCF